MRNMLHALRVVLTVVLAGLPATDLHAVSCPCVRGPYPKPAKVKSSKTDKCGNVFTLTCTNASRTGDFIYTLTPPGKKPKTIGRCVFKNGQNKVKIKKKGGKFTTITHICIDGGSSDGEPWDAVKNIFDVEKCERTRYCYRLVNGKWVEQRNERRVFTAAELLALNVDVDANHDGVADAMLASLTDGLYADDIADLDFPSLGEFEASLSSSFDGMFRTVVWSVAGLDPTYSPGDYIIFEGLTTASLISWDDVFTADNTEEGLKLTINEEITPTTGQMVAQFIPTDTPVDFAIVDEDDGFDERLVDDPENGLAAHELAAPFGDPGFKDYPGYGSGAGSISLSATPEIHLRIVGPEFLQLPPGVHDIEYSLEIAANGLQALDAQVDGWSVTLAALNGEISSATTVGTAADEAPVGLRTDGPAQTQIVSDPRNPAPSNTGILTEVALSSDASVTYDLALEPLEILKFSVSVNAPAGEEAQLVALLFDNDFEGENGAIGNSLSLQGGKVPRAAQIFYDAKTVELRGGGAVSDFASFVRGECNNNDTLDLSDVICLLQWRFLGGPAPGCSAGMDVNGDEAADISDGVWLLNYLFLGGPAPLAPFPDCGLALVGDLGCDTPSDGCSGQ